MQQNRKNAKGAEYFCKAVSIHSLCNLLLGGRNVYQVASLAFHSDLTFSDILSTVPDQ